MMPAMNMPAMPQAPMMPAMPMMPGMMMPQMMMPQMMGMMPQMMGMMPGMMMPQMMGMMPQMMMPGAMMMPSMACRVSMESGKDGVALKLMPTEGTSMDVLRERCDAMMKMMAGGMPIAMACGGQLLVCQNAK